MTAKILRDKFEADLTALRNICPHIRATSMQSSYRPGNFGPYVMVCDVCEKVLKQESIGANGE